MDSREFDFALDAVASPGSPVQTAYPGYEPPNVVKNTPALLETEVVVAGPRQILPNGWLNWEWTEFDRAVARYGLIRVIDIMLADPKVGSTIDTIKTAVLADGIQITPAILPKFGIDSESDEADDADAELSHEAGEFIARNIDHLWSPFPAETTLWELLDGMVYGAKLAEQVYRQQEGGLDDGALMLDRLKVKSNHSWAFAFDPFGNVQGIAAGLVDGQLAKAGVRLPKNPGLQLLPREKFAIFSHNPGEDDPRGRTILRRAFDPFHRKSKALGGYDDYLDHFASPTVVGETAPDQQPRLVRDPTTGRLTSADITPEQEMATALLEFKNNSVFVHKHGGKVSIIFPNGHGEPFLNALNYHDKQIVFAILMTSRATEEAQFGSRADSETAQDMMGLLIRYLKMSLGAMIRKDICRPLLVYNKGLEFANRFNPIISLGKTEHQDFSRNAGAVAKLWAAGFFDEGQRPGLSTFLGSPLPKPRKPEEQPAAVRTGKAGPQQPADNSTD